MAEDTQDGTFGQMDHQEYLDDKVHAKDHFALHPHDMVNLALEALKDGKRPGTDEFLKAGKIEPDAFIRSLNAPNIPSLVASERFNRLGQTLLDAHHRGVIDIHKIEPSSLPPSGSANEQPPVHPADRAYWALNHGILDPRQAMGLQKPSLGTMFTPGGMGASNAQLNTATHLMQQAAAGTLPQNAANLVTPAQPEVRSNLRQATLDPGGGPTSYADPRVIQQAQGPSFNGVPLDPKMAQALLSGQVRLDPQHLSHMITQQGAEKMITPEQASQFGIDLPHPVPQATFDTFLRTEGAKNNMQERLDRQHTNHLEFLKAIDSGKMGRLLQSEDFKREMAANYRIPADLKMKILAGQQLTKEEVARVRTGIASNLQDIRERGMALREADQERKGIKGVEDRAHQLATTTDSKTGVTKTDFGQMAQFIRAFTEENETLGRGDRKELLRRADKLEHFVNHGWMPGPGATPGPPETPPAPAPKPAQPSALPTPEAKPAPKAGRKVLKFDNKGNPLP